jgi:NADPH:quinone reductase-like Zn-dependent oxidoreductase
MHAIRLHEFGPAENLHYEEVADPEPGEGQVRIAVEANGVHLIDTQLRKGIATGPLPRPDLPMFPGREVAGVVDDVDPGVDHSGSAGARRPTWGRPAAGTRRRRSPPPARCIRSPETSTPTPRWR